MTANRARQNEAIDEHLIVHGTPLNAVGEFEINGELQGHTATTDGSNHSSIATPAPEENAVPTGSLPIKVHATEGAKGLIHQIEADFDTLARGSSDKRLTAMWDRAGEILRRVSLCHALLRQDFFEAPQVKFGDVHAARTIVLTSADTFTDLCKRGDCVAFESAEVLKLRKILKKKSGSVPLQDLVGSGISKAKAKQIARTQAEEFEIVPRQSGKAGKPALVIRFVSTAKAPPEGR